MVASEARPRSCPTRARPRSALPTFDEGEIVERLADGDLPEPRRRRGPGRARVGGARLGPRRFPPASSRDVVVAVPRWRRAVARPRRAGVRRADSESERSPPPARAWRAKLDRVTFALPRRPAGSRAARPGEPRLDPDQSRRAGDPARARAPTRAPGSATARSPPSRCCGSATPRRRASSSAGSRPSSTRTAGAVLRRPPRRRSGARARQPRRAHLPRGRVLRATRATARRAEEVWPHVEKAAAHIDALPRSSGAPPSTAPARSALLRPASRSRSATRATPRKPVHSYWDDFFGDPRPRRRASSCARGRSASADRGAAIAALATRSAPTCSPRSARDRAPARPRLHPRLRRPRRLRRDLDTIALEPGGRGGALPQRELASTFEKLLASVRQQARGGRRAAGNDYTPYECARRGPFVRLGRRDRADGLLDDFFSATAGRPAGTTGPRSSSREPRAPQFIGDMPHGWVGSDFLRSFLDLFAYERARTALWCSAPASPAPGCASGEASASAGCGRPTGRSTSRCARTARDVAAELAGPERWPPGGVVVVASARRPSGRTSHGRNAASSRRAGPVARRGPAPTSSWKCCMSAGRPPGDCGRRPPRATAISPRTAREYVDHRPAPAAAVGQRHRQPAHRARRQPDRQRLLLDRQLAARRRSRAGSRTSRIDRVGQVPLRRATPTTGTSGRSRRRPCWARYDRFACRHGMGYTTFETELHGIAAALDALLSTPSDTVEMWRVELEDALAAAPRRLELVALPRVVLRRLAGAAPRVPASSSSRRGTTRDGAPSSPRNHMWDVASPRCGHWNTELSRTSARSPRRSR